MDQEAGRRRRRVYSPQFKAEAVAACRKRGTSLAAAALERSMNANLLRRWVVEAERADVGVGLTPKALPTAASPPARDSFIAVPMLPEAVDDKPIKVQVHRGTLRVDVQWPSNAAHECALWLREVLK